MDEMPVERPKGTNWLPIVVGALLLLLLLGWCARRSGNDSTGAGGTASGAVGEFARYTTAHDTAQETEGNHQYTAGGVRLLAAALESVAANNPNIGVYADSMRRSVDRLQWSAASDVHADDAKAAFSAAVSAMEHMDRTHGRTRDLAPMRAIFAQLNSNQPLLPQLPTVQRFFEAARDALQADNAGR